MCRNIFNCSVSWAERENAAANLTQMKATQLLESGCKGVKFAVTFEACTG